MRGYCFQNIVRILTDLQLSSLSNQFLKILSNLLSLLHLLFNFFLFSFFPSKDTSYLSASPPSPFSLPFPPCSVFLFLLLSFLSSFPCGHMFVDSVSFLCVRVCAYVCAWATVSKWCPGFYFFSLSSPPYCVYSVSCSLSFCLSLVCVITYTFAPPDLHLWSAV